MSRLMWNLAGRPRAAATPTPLAPFDVAARGAWSWEQPARLRPEWHLVVDGAPVATLTRRGFLQRSAGLVTATGTWTLAHRFPGDVVATGDADPSVHARFRPGWFGGGRIEREGRDALLWRRQGFWPRRWAIQTGDKLPLVLFERRGQPFSFRHTAAVELEDAARRLDDLPLLLGFGWLLVLDALRSQHGDG